MDIVLGIVAVAIGALVCGAGPRFHTLTLPVGAFISGAAAGASGIGALLGDGVLARTLAIIVGLVIGAIAARIAHTVWHAGMILIAGLLGGMLCAAIAHALGVDAEWLLLTIGLVGAAACMVVANANHFPVYIVVGETALTGALLALAGLLLILDEIDLREIATGAIWRYMAAHTLPWLILAPGTVAGIVIQLAAARREALTEGHQAHAT